MAVISFGQSEYLALIFCVSSAQNPCLEKARMTIKTKKGIKRIDKSDSDRVISLPRRPRLVDAELILGGGLNAKLFDLLVAVDSTGSLNQGSKKAGLSYKGAWDMLERASALSPRPLVETTKGGGDGGGSKLTETGKTLLAAFTRFQEEKELFLETLNREFGHDPIILQWLRRLFMKSSARNQWQGYVSSVHLGAVTAEVGVTLNGGARIVASVTNESAKMMALANGKEVIALVRAPMVMLLTDFEGYLLSARNQMSGKVSYIQTGPVTTEVTIGLDSGDTVVAAVTSESAESLGLVVGKPATAVFKAGAVILATKP